MSSKKPFRLNTGSSIPEVGLGTWKSSPEDAYNSVRAALDTGYRHIDCAWIYRNEPEVGKAIKDSGIPRSEIFVTTKLWGTFHSRVEECLDSSLKRLGLEYVDLYLMHWPVALNPNGNPPDFPLLSDGRRDLHDWHFTKTWEAMEKLPVLGKVKAIGAANFDIYNLEILKKSSRVVPAVNQVEIHPYLQQRKLFAFCESEGIHVTAYSPLGSTGSPVKTEKAVLEIASEIATHSIRPSHIRSDFEVISLSVDEMKQIDALERNERYCNSAWIVTVFHDDE
ncbi:GCY protein [Glonium stellatum]|uniref:GCY protein n=1 Tax=Glonium stellatum TaxID=574774 RepID=A0A8E2EPC2_9PEZI|nr:GCY protein [Glonium stellatum]